MGACVVTIDDSGFSPIDAAVGYEVRGTCHLSTTYANGTGDTFTAAQCGLGVISKMQLESGVGYNFRYNATNGTIQAYWTGTGDNAVFTEVTNGNNLSAVTFDFIARGT